MIALEAPALELSSLARYDATSAVRPTTLNCEGCTLRLPSVLLACPSCGQLVHRTQLEELAAQAEQAERARVAVHGALVHHREDLRRQG